MKKFLQEFKDFAMRGSVIDLAVGVIIGGAFQKIVNSLVKDILSPILGLFAKNSFDDLSISFMGVTVRYGSFITEVINFIIMAFVIFLLVKALNSLAKLHGHTENDDPTTKQCPFCMSEIDINATRDVRTVRQYSPKKMQKTVRIKTAKHSNPRFRQTRKPNLNAKF